MIEIDDDIFHKNLLLTQAYCELQLKNGDSNPTTALRTFNPVYNGHELFSYKRGNSFGVSFTTMKWNVDPIYNGLIYNELFEIQLIHKKDTVEMPSSGIEFNGRILVAEIDYVISDGVSEDESEGFIDYNDCPPIDTWFYMAANENKRILFAWIPQKFVPLVQKGWEVNMLETFLWYENWLLREENI